MKMFKWHTDFVSNSKGGLQSKELEKVLNEIEERGHSVFQIIGPVQDAAGSHTGFIIVSDAEGHMGVNVNKKPS